MKQGGVTCPYGDSEVVGVDPVCDPFLVPVHNVVVPHILHRHTGHINHHISYSLVSQIEHRVTTTRHTDHRNIDHRNTQTNHMD